jgi:hypothetical protein
MCGFAFRILSACACARSVLIPGTCDPIGTLNRLFSWLLQPFTCLGFNGVALGDSVPKP